MRPGTGYIALLVLVVIGVIGLTQFITGMTDLEMAEQQISRNPHMDHMWMTLGACAAIAILYDYVPKWIEKLRNTNLKRILGYGSLIVIAAIGFSITPMKDMDVHEQKIWMYGFVIVGLIIYLIGGIIYQKKRQKKDAENPDDPPNENATEESGKE